jgi:hypothetical protein
MIIKIGEIHHKCKEIKTFLLVCTVDMYILFIIKIKINTDFLTNII